MKELGNDLKLLGTLADAVSDLEAARIATENRLRIILRSEEDKDGKLRGFAMQPNDRIVVMFSEITGELTRMEKINIKFLERTLDQSKYSAFQKRYRGLGKKQLSRLLNVIGDPYHDGPEDENGEPRPRKVSELWTYCGYGDAQRQRKLVGQKINWSPEARSRMYVIAESLMKAGHQVDDKRGPQDPVADHFRIVYDDAKEKYANAVHAVPCPRCTGKGLAAAQPGTPLKQAHIHARALRAINKEFLKLLWLEARPT